VRAGGQEGEGEGKGEGMGEGEEEKERRRGRRRGREKWGEGKTDRENRKADTIVLADSAADSALAAYSHTTDRGRHMDRQR